mgnify:FL=1
MKRTNAATQVARVAVVALCAVALAVGLPACGRSSSSGSSADSAASSSQAESAATEKNGFDQATNSSLSFSGFEFSIPSYWQGPTDKSTDMAKYYTEESGNSTPMMAISSESINLDPSKTDFSTELDSFQNNVIKNKNLSHAQLTSSDDTTIAGLPGRVFQLTGVLSNTDMTLRYAVIVDAANDQMVSLLLIQKAETETSYIADFDKIVSSTTVTKKSSDTSTTTTTTTTAPTTTTTTNTSSETTYEDIYNEYAQKLQDATPGLIDEYNQEAAANTEGVTGLATICDKKISKLAAISTEGTEKMAQLMYTSGSGSYQDYEDWAMKLSDVYTTEAQKITDAYMDSAM